MGIDIRMPIGLFFILLGLLLTAFGAISDSALYQKSLGLNVNFWWGLALLAFGIFMFVLAQRDNRQQKTKPTDQ